MAKRKVISLILSVLMVFTSVTPTFASTVGTIKEETSIKAEEVIPEPEVVMSKEFETNLAPDDEKYDLPVEEDISISLTLKEEIEEKDFKGTIYTEEDTLSGIYETVLGELKLESFTPVLTFNLSLEGFKDKGEFKMSFTDPYKDIEEMTEEQEKGHKEYLDSFKEKFSKAELYLITDDEVKKINTKVETLSIIFELKELGTLIFISDPAQIEEEPVELPSDVGISYLEGEEDTEAVLAQNIETEEEVVEALVEIENLPRMKAKGVALNLGMNLMSAGLAPEGVERQGDGSNIEAISAKWITADTEDNGDDALLYLKPANYDDSEQIIKLQINYALSGEHDYDPGDVTITVPAHIFKDRNGNDYGRLIIPYAEEPSMKNDFNWKRIGDTYVLTNTRKMSAATKGFIQFAIAGLIPHEVVDSEVTDDFSAYIEVVTHAGNIIGLESNSINAMIDTEAKVVSASKRVSGSPTRVSYTEIPEDQRVDGEDEYIVINWQMWGRTVGNTVYDLKMEDVIFDDYEGFIISTTEIDDRTLVDESVQNTYRTGETKTWNIKSAYPASQFDPDVLYTFNNKVTLTLTEEDPEIGDDPQLVTVQEATAKTTYMWHYPEWINPRGHFMVHKNGNDDNDNVFGSNRYTTHRYYDYYNYSDENLRADGYWGTYNKALNDLRDGATDYEIGYTVNTIGYIMPWTYEPDGTEESARKIENYGKHTVTMVTEDKGVRIVGLGDLTIHTDYDFTAVEFPYIPVIYSAVPKNINPDGSWTAVTAGDGTFEYSIDSDTTHIPEIILEIYKDGVWTPYAKANYTSGTPVVTLIDGTPIDGIRADLPTGTDNFRTVVTTNLAGLTYDVRPIITLHNNAKIKAMVNTAFSLSNVPIIYVYNKTNMTAHVDDNEENIVDLTKDGYDKLKGYTTETKVVPDKTSRQTLSQDVDFEKRLVTIHYSATVEERSYINDKYTYEEAIKDGSLQSEKHGIWRDLLPKGVTPVLSTIKLREKDEIVNAYTIEDYHGSGRTMLVVEADLTPVTTQYVEGSDRYYEDLLRISFDAIYGFDEILDYGDTVHNVISYESGNDYFGTIEKYTAEPDNPDAGNHIASSEAFIDDDEKELMTDLNGSHNKPVFVYAGTTTHLNILSAARTSLSKDVQTNFDGWWSDGLYYNDEEANKRTVYTSGYYQYRLRMMSDTDTISKDLILFDSLENFYAGDGNDVIDIDAPRWQGTYVKIDTSQLEDMGCAPVVYYSIKENLLLSDESDDKKANHTNTDLTNTDIWVKASDFTGEMSDVKAIAVDASKKTNGEDFTLEPMESCLVIVTMKAPDADEAAQYIADDAHAYNNAYLLCTSIDSNTGVGDSDNFVRKDYTKVGLEEYKITVDKTWADDFDRDGIRPENVTVRLIANGIDTGKTLTLDGTEAKEFTNIPYSTATGQKIIYSVREDNVEGYVSSISRGDLAFHVTNTHEPELISVSGTKTWEGDDDSVRPKYITVTLYGNDNRVTSKVVRPDEDGNWEYEFTGLYKNEGGQPITYRVEEVQTTNIKSYIPEYDGYDIKNSYHPYGDLKLSKEVTNGTAACEGQEFTFIVSLTTGTGENKAPITGEYEYIVTDENDDEVRRGTFQSNDEVKLMAGETIHFIDLPEWVDYEITEESVSGYKIVSKSNLTGKIEPNTTKEAHVTNNYSSEGRINLVANKVLNNRKITKSQFTFEMYDENGVLIKTSVNAAPTSTTIRGDGTVDYSNAIATFGALYYTEGDDGKTFTYIVKERNRNKQGYTYDDTEYTVTVIPHDMGDGTMNCEVNIEKKDGDGATPSSSIDFENTYSAEGEITLRAWKVLEGKSLSGDDFTFELLDEDGNVIQTKKNTSDGSIVFDAIKYDETDIGKTYVYAIREVKDNNPIYNYDRSVYSYTVRVEDNGDGTLSFVQNASSATPIYASTGISASEETLDLRTNIDDSMFTKSFSEALSKMGYYGESPFGIPAGNGLVSFILTTPGEEIAPGVYTEPVPIFSHEFRAYSLLKLKEDGSYIVSDALKSILTPEQISALETPQIDADMIIYRPDSILFEDIDIDTVMYNNMDPYVAAFETDSDGRWSAFLPYGLYYFDTVPTHTLWFGEVNVDAFFVAVPYLAGGMENVYDIVGWDIAEDGSLPVFTNTLKDGSLRVEKHIDGEGPDELFHFKVKLIGQDIEDREFNLDYGQNKARYIYVTYDANGGHFDSETELDRDVEYTLNDDDDLYYPSDAVPEDPTWEGHTFEGWYEDEDYIFPWDESKGISGAKTVYAKWDVESYTVTFNSNGGTSVTSQTVNWGDTATSPTDPTKTGLIFDGWYKDEGLTEAFDFSTPITSDITLYAKWKNPPAKYAVQVYGIGQDKDISGDTMGLTFGPAIGGNYTTTSKSAHIALADETSTDMCIHNHTWEEIIAQNIADPTVFQNCIANGCTKTVELDIPASMKGTLTDSAIAKETGDGPGVIYNELANGYRYWRYYHNGSSYTYNNTGGWGVSNIRAMLNGADAETDPESWVVREGDGSTLLDAFPDYLVNAMGYRETKYDSVYNAKTEANLKTTYDKLFLLSPNEMNVADSVSTYYQHPLEADFIYQKFDGQSLTQSSNNFYVGYQMGTSSGSSGSWWLRSVGSRGNSAVYVYVAGLLSYVYTYYTGGVAPAFSLAR